MRLWVPEADEDAPEAVVDSEPGRAATQVERRNKLLEQVVVFGVVIAGVVERGAAAVHIEHYAAGA